MAHIDLQSGEATPDSPNNDSDPPPMRFEAETVEAVNSVRGALGDLLAELPGEVRRPRELQKLLGVDYKICWQVFNVVQASDPLAAVKHTPSPSAVKRFLASGLQLGVARKRIDAVREAIEDFNRVVRVHADDRDTFQSMVAAVAEDGDGASDLQQRRAAYRSMSHIWGVQIESHLAAGFVRRARSGEGLDECLLTIKRGFRRLRPDVSPIVYGQAAQPQRALDPVAEKKYRAPLLPEFCSRPFPKLRTVHGANSWVYTKLATEGIGRQSRVDLAFGIAWNNTPPNTTPEGRSCAKGGMRFRTPTGLFIFDYLIHRPSFPTALPIVRAFQDMPGDDSPAAPGDAPKLQLTERPTVLGRADKVMSHPDWPRYPELLRFAAHRLEWDLAEFDVVRLRVEFPVFASVIWLLLPTD